MTISGRPESILQNITLENISITYPGGGLAAMTNLVPGYGKEYAAGKFGDRPAAGLYARNVDGLTLRNVAFTFASQDGRPALVFSDINGLNIDGFSSQKSTEGTLLKIERVRNCTISNTMGIKSRQEVTIDRASE